MSFVLMLVRRRGICSAALKGCIFDWRTTLIRVYQRSSAVSFCLSDHPITRSPGPQTVPTLRWPGGITRDHPIPVALCFSLGVPAKTTSNWPQIHTDFIPLVAPKSLLFNYSITNYPIINPPPPPPCHSTQLHPRSPNCTQASAEGHNPKKAKRQSVCCSLWLQTIPV
jgi:hypothetical protein